MSEFPHIIATELCEEAYKRAVIRVLEKQYIERFNRLMSEGKYDEICNSNNAIRLMKENAMHGRDNSHFLITINPPYEQVDDIKFLFDRINKITQTTVYKKAKGYVVFEQRSSGDEPIYGWHCHIFIPALSNTKSKIIKELHQKLTAKGGYTELNSSAIDVKYIDLKSGISYILGQKTIDKMSKVLKDRIARYENQLEELYEITPSGLVRGDPKILQNKLT